MRYADKEWMFSPGGYRHARKNGFLKAKAEYPNWMINREYNEMDIGSNNNIIDDLEMLI